MIDNAANPGDVLRSKLQELGVTPTEFARQIAVPANRITQIIGGKRSITGDTALRFGHWFGIAPEYWLGLQSQFDLANADRIAGPAIRHLPTVANLKNNLFDETTR